jgi:hypothetical protein
LLTLDPSSLFHHGYGSNHVAISDFLGVGSVVFAISSLIVAASGWYPPVAVAYALSGIVSLKANLQPVRTYEMEFCTGVALKQLEGLCTVQM